MASQADNFYFSQIGWKNQQTCRLHGKSVSGGLRDLLRTYGVSYAQDQLCSAAVGPWKQSNLSFFPPSIAGLLHWSRAKHPVLGEMRTQAGAGLFPTLPPYICFHILVTSCWRIKQEGEDSSLPRSPVFPQKPDEMWGHKERGETGSDMWKLLWKFPRKQKHKTIGLA